MVGDVDNEKPRHTGPKWMHNWYSDVFAILDCHGVWTEFTIFRFMKLLLSKINSSIMVIMCYHWMNSALSLACGQREDCWTGFNVGLCARDVACKGVLLLLQVSWYIIYQKVKLPIISLFPLSSTTHLQLFVGWVLNSSIKQGCVIYACIRELLFISCQFIFVIFFNEILSFCMQVGENLWEQYREAKQCTLYSEIWVRA